MKKKSEYKKEKKCIQCNKIYHSRDKQSKFCSISCAGKKRSTVYIKERNPNWKGGDIEHKCIVCGKKYLVKHNIHIINRGKFCSQDCLNHWLSEKFKGEKSVRWNGGITTTVCKQCKKTFDVKATYLRQGKGQFCSRKCLGLWFSLHNTGKNATNWKGGKLTKICETCGKSFKIIPALVKNGGGRFCSRKCLGVWHSKALSRENSPEWEGGGVIKECKYCKNKYTIKKSHGKLSNFCSKRCKLNWMSENLRGELAPNWRGGTSFIPYCFRFNKRRKDAVRKFFKVCICCGKQTSENITKAGKQKNLSVHHIDHDKEQGCNGRPFNLVTMCIECHGQELHNEEEYKAYINKTLEEGFKWGIWSKDQYEKEVMYPE
jgi:hypothetical protein